MTIKWLLVSALGLAAALQAQPLRTSVDDPRPLWRGLRILEEKRGWAVSYEDPQYSGADLVDRTAENYSGATRALMPRGGHLEAEIPGDATPSAAIRFLIDAGRRNHTAEFKSQLIGSMVVVIPPQGSPLDLSVSMPQKDRNLDEILRELAQNMSGLGPVRVHEPGMLVGSVARSSFGTNSEPARNVLVRALQAASNAGPRRPIYVWDLLYASNFGYVLNIHTVKQMVKTPDGGSKLIQVQAK